MNKDVLLLTEAYDKVQKAYISEVVFPELGKKIPFIKRHSLQEPGPADNKGNATVLNTKTDITAIGKKMMIVALDNAYGTKQPLLIFGPPGNAKSQIVIQFAQRQAKKRQSPDGGPREFKYWNKCSEQEQNQILQAPGNYFVLFDIRTGRYDPTDLTGVPIIVPDVINRSVLRSMKYLWIVLLCKPETDGILFFDEINQGSRGMMNLLMGISLDRDFDGIPMSEHVSIVAAGNLEGGYNTALPPALMNRFTAGVLTLDPEDWLEWAEAPKEQEGATETNVDSWITSFVKSDLKKYRMVMPITENNTPFPSWRAFQKLSDKMRYIEQKHEAYRRQKEIPEVDMFEEVAFEASALCGVNWAQDFMLYIGYTSAFNIEELLANPKQFIEDHLKESKVDANGNPIQVNGVDARALKRGRVYSFITWIATRTVEGFKQIKDDPTFRVIIKDKNGGTKEVHSDRDIVPGDIHLGVQSQELNDKVPSKNVATILAFGNAIGEVLESNDDRAVLKDSVTKLLGRPQKYGQLISALNLACKSTGLVDINKLKDIFRTAKNEMTRITAQPTSSTGNAQVEQPGVELPGVGSPKGLNTFTSSPKIATSTSTVPTQKPAPASAVPKQKPAPASAVPKQKSTGSYGLY